MENQSPTSCNPRDYAVAVRVEDDQALMLKAELDDKARKCRRLETELDVARSEQSALRDRLFLRLDDVYPGVWTMDPQGGIAIRVWQNNLYYVAWDAETKR
jgi:hypothetical protein